MTDMNENKENQEAVEGETTQSSNGKIETDVLTSGTDGEKSEKEKARERKKEKRIKRALRSYRCRFLKNFFIWLWGVVSFVILFVAGIAILLGAIPVKSLLGKDSDKAGVVADESLLTAIMNINSYTFGDVPYAKKLIEDLNDIDIMDGKKLSDFVSIDTTNLEQVQIMQFFNQIDTKIKVVATLDGVVGIDTMGDLGRLEIFSNWTEVTTVVDANAQDFNPAVYYYKVSEGNYQRAFKDDKTLVAPQGSTLYYPALAYIPVLEAVDLIDERLGSEKLTDLITTLGGADLTDNSMINKILGDKTISQVGEITDIELDSFFPEAENQDLYNILRAGAEIPAGEKVTINSLNGLDINKIKLSGFIEETAENESLFNILRSATSTPDGEEITVGALSNIDVNNIVLSDVVEENAENENLFNILRSATSTPDGEEITIGALSNVDIDNIVLSDVIKEDENSESLYKILRSGIGLDEGEEITFEHLESLDPDNIDLESILHKNTTNEKLFELLRSALDLEETDPITIEKLEGLDTNRIDVEAIIEQTETNVHLFDILHHATGTPSNRHVTIGDMKNFSMDGVFLYDVLELEEDSALYKVLTQSINPNYDEITVSQLASLSLDNVLLSTVISNPSDDLKNILGQIYDVEYDDIKVSTLSGTLNFGNIKLSTIIKEDTGNIILDSIRSDSSVTVENMGDKVNALSLYTIYGENAFTTDYRKTANTNAKYSKSIVGGKVVYQLSASGSYYIDKSSSVWLLVCYDYEIDEDTGLGKKYTQSNIAFANLEEGNSLTQALKNATIRQLIDLEILDSSIPERLHAKTLSEALLNP